MKRLRRFIRELVCLHSWRYEVFSGDKAVRRCDKCARREWSNPRIDIEVCGVFVWSRCRDKAAS